MCTLYTLFRWALFRRHAHQTTPIIFSVNARAATTTTTTRHVLEYQLRMLNRSEAPWRLALAGLLGGAALKLHCILSLHVPNMCGWPARSQCIHAYSMPSSYNLSDETGVSVRDPGEVHPCLPSPFRAFEPSTFERHEKRFL